MLNECHQATLRNQRAYQVFQHLCQPGERLVIIIWDSTDQSLPKSGNHSTQKRTYSTKSNENCLHKLECCDATGIVVYTCIVSASTTPSCTDESVSYFLVTEESRLRLNGGMERVFIGIPGFRVVNLMDKGWERWGWGNAPRPSFRQWADQKQLTHPHFHYFLPSGANDPILDVNLRPAGRPAFGLRRRMVIFLIIVFLFKLKSFFLRLTCKQTAPGSAPRTAT